MAKFQLTRPGGPWIYDEYGFTAVDGAILDGTLSSPTIAGPPDAYWTAYAGGSAETGISRHGASSFNPVFTEPADGTVLAYNAASNQPEWRSPSAIVTTPPATAVLFGTSQEFSAGIGADAMLNTANTYDVTTRGWWNWCKSYLGHKLDLLHNSGVNGNTTTQMLARIDTDVLAYDPGWVFIGGPTNDTVTGMTSATTIANLTAIYNKLKGRRVVQLTAGARTEVDTTAERQALAEVNAWIVNAPTQFPHVMVVDTYRLYVDPAASTAAVDTTIDGVHYTEATANRIGFKVAQSVAPLLPLRPRRSVVMGSPANVLGDPGMLTAGWTNNNVTDSTLTFVNDDDTYGRKASLAITGNTGGTAEHSIRFVENTSGGRWVVGDKVRAEVRIRFTNLTPVDLTTARRFQPILRLWTRAIDGTQFVTTDQALGLSSAELNKQTRGLPATGEIILRTPPRVIPASIDRLYIDIGWLGTLSGTLEISEPNIIKLP